MFCNRCGSAVTEDGPVCSGCGARLPEPSAPVTTNKKVARTASIVVTLLIRGTIGIVWNVIAAAVLFRSYSFFEAVVVCLLVMILCAVATLLADLEPWRTLRPSDAGKHDDGKDRESDLPRELAEHLRVFFYGIGFAMALVKLVMTLVG